MHFGEVVVDLGFTIRTFDSSSEVMALGDLRSLECQLAEVHRGRYRGEKTATANSSDHIPLRSRSLTSMLPKSIEMVRRAQGSVNSLLHSLTDNRHRAELAAEHGAILCGW